MPTPATHRQHVPTLSVASTVPVRPASQELARVGSAMVRHSLKLLISLKCITLVLLSEQCYSMTFLKSYLFSKSSPSQELASAIARHFLKPYLFSKGSQELPVQAVLWNEIVRCFWNHIFMFMLFVFSDINECPTNPCQANARCTNNVGSYACSCVLGFKLNPLTNKCDGKLSVLAINPYAGWWLI